MGKTWTYEDVVIAMIHEEWRRGNNCGLSAWDILRRLHNVGLKCQLASIVSALHTHQSQEKLVIVENKVVPFRYRVTRAGVTTGKEARARISSLKKRSTALPSPK
ncbi:hypothetical protein CL652_01645 [bacterium]|nr:hypothetical protein [bacterium]